MSASLPPRRLLPQPVETTTKSKRRNAPEVDESISKSDRESPASKESTETGHGTRTGLNPLTVETTTKSNRKCVMPEHRSRPDAPRIRKLPQPVETTTASSRGKFSPQLIETTKRSRKMGDAGPALLSTDKTQVSPADNDHQPRPIKVPRPGALPLPPVNTPISSTSRIPQVPESRYSSANLSRNTTRRHSFRVPDLASIQSQPDSEESEGSNCPSLSTSPSASSQDTELHKHVTRLRESCDDRFSGYLLALAARAAEKQLRDQAMAAYPNEALHEHVDHFAVDRESDTSEEEASVGLLPHERGDINLPGRQSTIGTGWEFDEMRLHEKEIEWQKEKPKQTELADKSRRISVMGPFQKAPQALKQVGQACDGSSALPDVLGGQKATGLDRMRSAASPPMLGNDIQFPVCESPRQTRFEVDQHAFPQQGSGATTPRERSGLWTPGACNSRQGSGRGLWMGVCALSDKDGLAPPKPARTGLITPAENHDSFADMDNMDFRHHLPASPPDSNQGSNMACIDGLLFAEQEIQRECNDAFVTQVYNYLSLGYPSMARKFDEELCKITRVPVEELRRDDHLANTKGYVGTPEGSGVTQDGVSDGQCGRWRALKLYVREWARQKPRMAASPDLDAWGDRARRGSWAI
ncbi:MAG: hypothetical protein M1830_000922 [Pleopsidium flavum]|nr:MAG: hypothetical protein M1830_000922 [Pleopsidium flavum]